MTRKIEFLDTSLRDGEQTPGVNFSVKERLLLLNNLKNGEFRPSKLASQLLVQIHLKQYGKSLKQSPKLRSLA